MIEQFENKTIGELRKLTEDYERLAKENLFLRTKYPSDAKKLDSSESLNDLLKEVGVKCL